MLRAVTLQKMARHDAVARTRFLYLHGFASSPSSRKAQFFASRLQAEGITLQTPVLDGGDFKSLTVSNQMAIAEQQGGSDDVVLIGSSMGGYLAALYAARNPKVRGLVLLAPAFNLLRLWQDRLGQAGVERWQRKGFVPVFHYGLGREAPLGSQFLDDAKKFEAEPQFKAPALIFHGNQDDVVPVTSSIEYVERHPNTQLVRLEARHELTEVLEPIWELSKPFLLRFLVAEKQESF